MAKGTSMDEIKILQYFETGPIEKAEVVFNIVREKMRERVSGRAQAGGEAPPRHSVRKRQVRKNAEARPGESGSAAES